MYVRYMELRIDRLSKHGHERATMQPPQVERKEPRVQGEEEIRREQS